MANKETTEDPKYKEPPVCDNHPDRPAILDSDLNGAIQPIHLCDQCVNTSNLQRFV